MVQVSPELNTALQLWSHQRPVEGKDQRTASLDLLTALLLMQPRRLLAFFATRTRCWLMFNSLPAGTPSPFLPSCFQPVSPQPIPVCGVIPPQVCRILLFPLSFVTFPSTHFSVEISEWQQNSIPLVRSMRFFFSSLLAAERPGGHHHGVQQGSQHWQGTINAHLLPC